MSVVRNSFLETLSVELGGLTVETSMKQVSIWGIETSGATRSA